jgi:hypothetical protein
MKMRRIEYYLWSVAIILGLLILNGEVSRAGDVTSYGIWVDRFQEDGKPTFCAFCSDVWGTVEFFDSIILTSPPLNTYSLSLASEGDQWAFDKEGKQTAIEAEFPDGIYTFNVTYNDGTLPESISLNLGGSFPVFPSNITVTAVTGGQVTWDAWSSPVEPVGILVEIEEVLGTNSVRQELSYTETSYLIPSGFLQDNTTYELSISFISSMYPLAHKSSISKISFHTIIVDIVPDTITTKTKWITCHIWPPDGYDATQIVLDSIRLNGGVKPVRTSIRKKNQILVIKFPTSGLPSLEPGPLNLTVTGELNDATTFEVTDSVEVVQKGGKPS